MSLLGDTALYTVLPTHTAEAGVLLVSVGILLSANRFVRLLANGAVGWISDRWPRRRVFVPALFLGTLSTAIYALTQGFAPLLWGRLLWGIAWSGIWVAGNAIVFDVASVEKRGRWIGVYQVSFFLGASAGAFLGGFLTDWLGYHRAFGVAAGLNLLGALVAWLFVPETSHLRTETAVPTATAIPTRQAAVAKPARWTELASATALLGVNRIVIAGIFISTFGVFLLERVGESVEVMGRSLGVATLTGLALGTNTILSMVSAPLVGGLSDRVGSRWLMAAAGLVSGTAGFGLLAWGVPWLAGVGLPLTAVASGSNQSLSTALVGDLSPRGRRGRLLGLLFTIGDFGSAIGPPLAYALIPLWGVLGVYWLSASLFGLMLLLALHWSVRQAALGQLPG